MTKTREQMIEAAIEALQVRHVDDVAPKHYQQGQRYGLEVGYRAGYEAAIAADRSRIIAELRAEDAEFSKGSYAVDQCCVSIDRVIEIVKEKRDDK